MHTTFVLLALFLLSGCRSDTSWTVDRVASGHSKFNSTKLTYTAADPINGLDLEFLKTQEHLYVYLNVHSVPIPPLKTDPHHSFVYITVDTEKRRFEALRREGGQRLLLPEDAINLITSSLDQQLPVEITVSGYSSLISPSDFSKKYKKNTTHPHFRKPLSSSLLIR